jgi:hypothetical protein
LQTKLLKARPDILSVAASQFNLHLEFSEDFDKHISAAQAIAEKLHGEGLLTSWVDKVKPSQIPEALRSCRVLLSVITRLGREKELGAVRGWAPPSTGDEVLSNIRRLRLKGGFKAKLAP